MILRNIVCFTSVWRGKWILLFRMNSWSHSCLYNRQIFVFTSGEYVEACFASPPSPVLISIISVLSVSLCKFPASVSSFVNLTLPMCSFFLVFHSQSISPVQEKFLDIAKNVVHNMSVLIIQCGYYISGQVFSSFLCFLATLKPLSFVILLNCGVNPGSLGTVTTPRAASSSLLLLSFSFIASGISILVYALSSNTSSIFFNSLWRYCWSHSTISLSYYPLIIPFLCFLCNRIVSWWKCWCFFSCSACWTPSFSSFCWHLILNLRQRLCCFPPFL